MVVFALTFVVLSSLITVYVGNKVVDICIEDKQNNKR